MSSNSNTAESYFPTDASKMSTPSSTAASTPSLKAQDNDVLGAPKTALPVLMREFPKPTEEVDVKQALERQPGRWTIQGQIAANQKRVAPSKSSEKLREERAREFEAAKRDLLASRN